MPFQDIYGLPFNHFWQSFGSAVSVSISCGLWYPYITVRHAGCSKKGQLSEGLSKGERFSFGLKKSLPKSVESVQGWPGTAKRKIIGHTGARPAGEAFISSRLNSGFGLYVFYNYFMPSICKIYISNIILIIYI